MIITGYRDHSGLIVDREVKYLLETQRVMAARTGHAHPKFGARWFERVLAEAGRPASLKGTNAPVGPRSDLKRRGISVNQL